MPLLNDFFSMSHTLANPRFWLHDILPFSHHDARLMRGHQEEHHKRRQRITNKAPVAKMHGQREDNKVEVGAT